MSYKRFDLAIAACLQLGRRLVIAGSGPMEGALRAQAAGQVDFVINPSDAVLARLMAEADALLFPGVEDFGMIAIEAMAAGTPVIAYAAGGARDFVIPGRTGVFFEDPTSESLAAVIAVFKREQFAASGLVAYAAGYSRNVFLQRMRGEIAALMTGSPS